jgi:type II secretory pathway component PulF
MRPAGEPIRLLKHSLKAAICAVFLGMFFIVPIFANLFAGLGVDLPFPSSWIRAMPGWLLLVIVILTAVTCLTAFLFVLRMLVRQLLK